MNTQTLENFKLWAGLKHCGRGPVHSIDRCQYWIEDGSVVCKPPVTHVLETRA